MGKRKKKINQSKKQKSFQSHETPQQNANHHSPQHSSSVTQWIEQWMETLSSWKSTNTGLFFFAIVLCVLIVGVYLPTFWGAVFLDDYKYILDNHNIKSLTNIPNLLNNFYIKRGFNQITYAVDYYLFSANLAGFHLTSLLFHLVNALLVWACFSQLYRLMNLRIQTNFFLPFGLVAALFFALLPINTQPVAYLISRANLIATFFFLAGYWLSLLIVRKTRYFDLPWVQKCGVFLCINLVLYTCAFLGMGGKEISATLPVVFLITLPFITPTESCTRKLFEFSYFAIPLLLGIAAFLWLRWQLFQGTLGIPDMEARSPWINLLTQFGVIHLYYGSKILFPFQLYLDPVFPEIHSVFDPRFLWSLFIFLSLMGLALYWRKRVPFLLFGLLWFYITIAPTSSLIPLWDIVAERRVYLPSIGLAFLFEAILLTFFSLSKRNLVLYLLMGTTIYFAGFTLKRNIEFTSAIDLWKQEYQSYPSNARAFYNVLQSYLEQGKQEEGKEFFLNANMENLNFTFHVNTYTRINHIIKFMLVNQIELPKAVQMAERLAEMMPQNTDVLNTLQTAYLQTDQPEQAHEIIDRILKLEPNNLVALQHKALLLSQQQKHDQALNLLHQAAKAHPTSLTVHQQLRNYYAFLGKETSELDKTIETLKKNNFEKQTEIDVLLD